MTLQPGQTLDGKYRVVRLLREGGVGAIYVAEHARIRRQVAIKVLKPGVPADSRERFEREAQAAGQIGSDHIVEVLDFGTTKAGEPYMVMEFLQGQTLKERVREKPLTPAQAVPILAQILRGLQAAHGAGIIHRDLKSDNVFVLNEKAGQRDFVKILDFGICKFQAVTDHNGGMTQPDMVMGTPFYMSPEQIASSSDVDERADVYSAGVILYEAVTGKAPFGGTQNKTLAELLFQILATGVPDPRKLVPDLDPGFCEIVARATAREKSERYPSAKAFEEALIGWARAKDFPELRRFLMMSDAGVTARTSPKASVRPPIPRLSSGPVSVAPTRIETIEAVLVEAPKKPAGAGARAVLKPPSPAKPPPPPPPKQTEAAAGSPLSLPAAPEPLLGSAQASLRPEPDAAEPRPTAVPVPPEGLSQPAVMHPPEVMGSAAPNATPQSAPLAASSQSQPAAESEADAPAENVATNADQAASQAVGARRSNPDLALPSSPDLSSDRHSTVATSVTHRDDASGLDPSTFDGTLAMVGRARRARRVAWIASSAFGVLVVGMAIAFALRAPKNSTASSGPVQASSSLSPFVPATGEAAAPERVDPQATEVSASGSAEPAGAPSSSSASADSATEAPAASTTKPEPASAPPRVQVPARTTPQGQTKRPNPKPLSTVSDWGY